MKLAELREELEQYWPPNRIVITCDTCNASVHDTAVTSTYASIGQGTMQLHHSMHAHMKPNHKSFTIDVDAQQKEEMEVTING